MKFVTLEIAGQSYAAIFPSSTGKRVIKEAFKRKVLRDYRSRGYGKEDAWEELEAIDNDGLEISNFRERQIYRDDDYMQMFPHH
jgi:hypothetical protein